jgi:hypothetical protein
MVFSLKFQNYVVFVFWKKKLYGFFIWNQRIMINDPEILHIHFISHKILISNLLEFISAKREENL